MSESGDGVGRGRQRWLVLASCVWAVLGLWNLFEGQVFLGLAEIVLAGVSLAAGLSARVASIVDGPLFRRK